MRTAQQIADDLRRAVDEGLRLLANVPEAATTIRRTDEGWCPREIIGHLIDSACNNHRRFILNQTREQLSIEPYHQTEWTMRQRYSDEPMAQLTSLWAAYNRHLAHVIEVMPDAVLQQGRGPVGGLGFAYTPIETDAASIGLLAEDYVGHIRHHLKQIRRILTPA